MLIHFWLPWQQPQRLSRGCSRWHATLLSIGKSLSRSVSSELSKCRVLRNQNLNDFNILNESSFKTKPDKIGIFWQFLKAMLNRLLMEKYIRAAFPSSHFMAAACSIPFLCSQENTLAHGQKTDLFSFERVLLAHFQVRLNLFLVTSRSRPRSPF